MNDASHRPAPAQRSLLFIVCVVFHSHLYFVFSKHNSPGVLTFLFA